MKARALMEGASFGPDALKVIAQAFDEAWKAVAGNFGEEPAVVEEAQVRLAKALLSVAADDSRDPEVLKTTALEAMALAYRDTDTRSP